MIRIAALENQRLLRDLAGLPRLCDEVIWCDTNNLAIATEPAMVVGLWLFDEPIAAKDLLKKRSEAGLATVIVPRFKTGDLRSVLTAPAAVNLKTGEYSAFLWNDGSTCEVPGQTIIETALHKGQWGEAAGFGVTVLSYRSHEAAGSIVLCTAGLASRRLDVSVNGQQWLLKQIIGRITNTTSKAKNNQVAQTTQIASSIDELLADHDPNIATVLLAVALNEGKCDQEEVLKTLTQLGFDFSNETVSQTLTRLPKTSISELENGLQQYGWGAFLRRGRLALLALADEGGNG